MYIPKHFLANDDNEAIAFMQRYSFATLVSSSNNYPEATHLPFLVEKLDDKLVLSSHFAKANPQAETITDGTSLVIFSEPHAYISPQHYEKELNVPTWNYIAIHAYGKAELVTEESKQLEVLEKMISFYDTAYLKQWATLPIDFKLKMVKGIVAFDITVTDLQAKHKLSQNRTGAERQNIINSLKDSPHTTEKEIAEYMEALKNK